jgi:hypothetical protein
MDSMLPQFPLIKDFETADLWEKARNELKLLNEKK